MPDSEGTVQSNVELIVRGASVLVQAPLRDKAAVPCEVGRAVWAADVRLAARGCFPAPDQPVLCDGEAVSADRDLTEARAPGAAGCDP
ncbi:hypothetical protein GCM10010464_84180 [Pseudonocardia yunnanensis]